MLRRMRLLRWNHVYAFATQLAIIAILLADSRHPESSAALPRIGSRHSISLLKPLLAL